MNFWKRSFVWGLIYGVILAGFTCFVILDTFVIERTYTRVESSQGVSSESGALQSESTSGEKQSAESAVSTDTTYSDENMTIVLTTYRENDTNIYVADVTVADPRYLKTAFAKSSYGKNVTEKTSSIAESSGAILAVNGDYYGARNSGYVIRNGTIYRDTASSDDQEDLVLYADGTMDIVKEGDITAAELLKKGASQVLSFGPGLVENGQISVTEDEEVGKSMASNPRTAVGMVDRLHYLFVVSDGRTEESAGLSLYQLAEFMQKLGAATAYNLDGGGSSTMYFNGNVINHPTTNGNKIHERAVSDIVSIGY